MTSHAEIKRLVIGGRKISKYDHARLFIAEHEGEMYATNSYWLTPAKMVAPLLDHFNLASDKASSFEVNSKVKVLDMEPPNISAIIPAKMGMELPVVEPWKVNSEGSANAYQRTALGYVALFKNQDTLQAFNADFLHWITNDGDTRGMVTGYGSRLGEIVYRQAGPGKPLVISAPREKQSGGNNGADGKYIPATWSADGEVFLGLLMPVRV